MVPRSTDRGEGNELATGQTSSITAADAAVVCRVQGSFGLSLSCRCLLLKRNRSCDDRRAGVQGVRTSGTAEVRALLREPGFRVSGWLWRVS